MSPYYGGSGTNFWPMVNNEFQCVGTTFMHIDRGIDTGEIINQIRAEIHLGDTPHQIGNRLIKDSFLVLEKLLRNFDTLRKVPTGFFPSTEGRLYKNMDFSDTAVKQLYQNFYDNGVVKLPGQNGYAFKCLPYLQESNFRLAMKGIMYIM